jgi:hypothetical protein
MATLDRSGATLAAETCVALVAAIAYPAPAVIGRRELMDLAFNVRIEDPL